MRDLLARVGFRRLLVGQTVSALGDWLGTVGLMVFVLRVTHGSSTAVGGVLVLRLLPAAVAAPLAARAVSKWDRKRTMLATDAARIGMAFALPIIPSLWWIYLWAFLIEAAGLVFLPARDAAIPVLAGITAHHGEEPPPGEPSLGIANGMVLATSYGTIPLGAGLFGALFLIGETIGLSPDHRFILVFWFDALTFLASYVAIRGIPRRGLQATDTPVAAPSGQSLRFRDALRVPLVHFIVPAAATVALGLGALFSIGVKFVTEVLHASSVEFGVLIALFGVGAAIGLAIDQRFKSFDRVTRVRIGVASQGAVVAMMSLVATLPTAFLGAVLFGAAATGTLVAGMSLLQDSLEGRDRDLAFAAFHIVIRGGLALAALVAGAASDLVPDMEWPLLGHMAAARIVLACAGGFVLLSASLVRRARERVVAL